MSIQLTSIAASELKSIKEKEVQGGRLPAGAGIRVMVQGGGCSGLSYRMGFDDKRRSDDQIFEDSGIPLMVDWRSYLYMVGTEIDFVDGPSGRGFVFKNPNAPSHSCGCSSSSCS